MQNHKKTWANGPNTIKHPTQITVTNKYAPNEHRPNFKDEIEFKRDDLREDMSNIQVAVRLRPLNSREIHISNFETIRVLDEKSLLLLDPNAQFDFVVDIFKSNKSKEKGFMFDMVFDRHTETATIFEKTTKKLIPEILEGFNATVFAYGATGAGKTFTMMGDNNHPGIMPLTVKELFQKINSLSLNKGLMIKISYLEVYNETLKDLLSEDEKLVELREDPDKGPVVSGITEVITTSEQEILTLLKIGNRKRTMEPTGANVVSSRSHAVLQIAVEQQDTQGLIEELLLSKLSLIDLAGSERASATNNRGQRMIEGANINKSLLALGNCITLLSERSERGLKNIFIPYRDSKLTRLLKDSLGGNCKTIMIANISPSTISFEDTNNTLKYASRAKNIKTLVTQNVVHSGVHIERFSSIISGLKQENDKLKHILNGNNKGAPLGPIFNENILREINEHFEQETRVKKRIFELEYQFDELGEKIIMAKNKVAINGDQLFKNALLEYISLQKSMMHQIETIKYDYNLLIMKRDFLEKKIQNEKSNEGIILLSSLFHQNKMSIENLEWQHKEERIENEVKLKNIQIQYLENQLQQRVIETARERTQELAREKTRNRSVPLLIRQAPQLFNQKYEDFVIEERPISESPYKFQGDQLNYNYEINDLESILPKTSLRALSPAKQAMYFPHIQSKIVHKIPSSQIVKKILSPVKRPISGVQHEKKKTNSVKNLLEAKIFGEYYRNLISKPKPYDYWELEQIKLKRKYGYIPHFAKRRPVIAQRTNTSEDSRHFEPIKAHIRVRSLPRLGLSQSNNSENSQNMSHLSQIINYQDSIMRQRDSVPFTLRGYGGVL